MRTPRRAVSGVQTLDECKIRASILLKDLRHDDRPRMVRAAERFQALPYFASLDPDTIISRRDSIRLKHALAVIAVELGYATWTECKRRLEVPPAQRLDTERFFEARCWSYLNRWFARYDEARASLESEGGYLFPYRHQFFICAPGFLADLGIDPADPDWERIGRDWVRPLDEAARDRLERKVIALGYGGREMGSTQSSTGRPRPERSQA
jgi:hypothetical protein